MRIRKSKCMDKSLIFSLFFLLVNLMKSFSCQMLFVSQNCNMWMQLHKCDDGKIFCQWWAIWCILQGKRAQGVDCRSVKDWTDWSSCAVVMICHGLGQLKRHKRHNSLKRVDQNALWAHCSISYLTHSSELQLYRLLRMSLFQDVTV